MSEPEFVEDPKGKDPNSIWHHFLRESLKPSQRAQCKLCNFKMKSQGRPTTSLWSHLKSQHGIDAPTNKDVQKSNSCRTQSTKV